MFRDNTVNVIKNAAKRFDGCVITRLDNDVTTIDTETGFKILRIDARNHQRTAQQSR